MIDNGSRIIKNTILNIKTIRTTDCGFRYNKKIGLSIQGADANKTFNEIINQCEKNNIKYELKIKIYK